MARKPAQVEEGAPLWVLTYGDMMSLLLTFFILLAAFSEIKDEDKYQEVSKSIQEAFGFLGGVGVVPSHIPPNVSPTLREMAVAAQNFDLSKGESPERGQDGRHTTVKTVREGLQFCLGGGAAFDEGRAEIRPEVMDDLIKVASIVHGYNHKIEIRGHTSKAPLPQECLFKDHMDLSLARARAVSDFLVMQGVNARRIRVAGVGDTEPLVDRAYDPEERKINSRVEITVLESLVTDFAGQDASQQRQGDMEPTPIAAVPG